MLLFVLYSCKQSVDTDYVRNHEWKWGEGKGRIGDWICFDHNIYKISNDTLFKRDTARAVVVSLDKNGWRYDNEMVIIQIQNGEHATYHEKK